MTTVTIDGIGDVEVDDTFVDLNSDQQQTVINNIHQSILGGQKTGNVGLSGMGVDEPDGFFDRAGQVIEMGARNFASSSAIGASSILNQLGIAPETQMDLEKYADYQDVKVSRIPGIKAIQDADDVGDVLTSILEYTGSSLPATGASVVTGAATGAAVGSMFPGIGTVLGSIGGGALGLYASMVGENIEETRRVTGREALTDEEMQRAQISGIGKSVAGSLINRLLPLRLRPGAVQNFFAKSAAGATTEGATEVYEAADTILQANNYNLDALRTPEAERILTEAALAGVGAGGLITGLSPAPRQSPKLGEGQAAVEASQPLEPTTQLTEMQVLNDVLEKSDTTDDVLQMISNTAKGYGEAESETSFQTLLDDMTAKQTAVTKQIEEVPEEQQEGTLFKDLTAQKAILDSTVNKLKQIQPLIPYSLQNQGLTPGEVRASSKGSRAAVRPSLRGTFIRAAGRATSPMIEGAQKNPIAANILSKITNFDILNKDRQQTFVAPVYNSRQQVSKFLNLPLTSPVTKRIRKSIAQIIEANRSALDAPIEVNAQIQTILRPYNKRRQEAILNASNDLKKVGDDIFKQGLDNGTFTEEDYTFGYVPSLHKWLMQGEKGVRRFADSASKVKGVSRDQAEAIGRRIMDEFNAPGEQFSSRDFALRGNIYKAVRRQPGFEKERTIPREISSQLLKDGLIDDDVFNVFTRYGQQAAHAFTIRDLFGDKIDIAGEPKNEIKAVMNALRQIDPSPEMQSFTARGEDIIDAIQGNYNPFNVSSRWRGLLSKLIQGQYILTLSTAGLTALSEPIIMLSRVRPGDAFYAIPRALNIAYRKTIREIFPRLRKGEVEKEFEQLIYGIDSVLSERLISSSAVDVSSIVTEKFFKLNLLSQVTQFSRALGYFAGKRAIDRDIAVAKSIPQTKFGERDRRNAMRRLSELGLRDIDRITPDQIRQAQIRLVDEFIMSPNIVNRPLWMANPALAPLAQLKSFMFVFGNTVGSRGYRNIVRGETLEGESIDVQERAQRLFAFTTTFVLLTGAIMYIKMMKDALRNWDGEDEDYSTIGWDFLRSALVDTNLLGPYNIIFQAIDAPKYGISPLVSILGPGAGQAERIFRALSRFYTSGDTRALSRELIRLLPGIGANPAARRSMVDDLEEAINNGTFNLQELADSL